MEERLQKIISRAGVASRRKAEEMISAGRVKVNGMAVKELGAKADAERDEIRVDGALISVALELVYVMVNKPEGYVTTVSDPEDRPTVMKLVKHVHTRVYPVGRLDYATSGLLLLTSDGELTRFLTHPSSNVPKTYEVKVKGRVSPEAIKALREGPKIDKKPLTPAEVRFLRFSSTGQHTWLIMTIHEGRTRQIRRMCEAVGFDVIKLRRVAIGPILLGDLPAGDFRWLTDKEISLLRGLMKAGKPEKDRAADAPAIRKAAAREPKPAVHQARPAARPAKPRTTAPRRTSADRDGTPPVRDKNKISRDNRR